jgi:hypothetical protein
MSEPPEHFTPTEKAIFYVTQYPCQHCVLPKLSTIDQLSSFVGLRQAQTFVALCWSARVVGRDDPLYPKLKDKSISRNLYDWAHLKASYFETLWGLCQILAPRIADELKASGRENLAGLPVALFLFKAAVMERANWSIELSFGYVEISGRNVDKALKLKAKSIREGLTQRESARLHKLSKGDGYHRSCSASLLALAVAQNFKNKAVMAQFELFMSATANLCEKEATMARKNGCWGWNNGVKLTGSKSSGYCPAHSES